MERNEDNPLVLVFMPALVAVLVHEEQEKGEPLTEEEVLEITDKAITITVPLSVARGMAESRGYDDLDPENVWAEWQEARQVILSTPEGEAEA